MSPYRVAIAVRRKSRGIRSAGNPATPDVLALTAPQSLFFYPARPLAVKKDELAALECDGFFLPLLFSGVPEARRSSRFAVPLRSSSYPSKAPTRPSPRSTCVHVRDATSLFQRQPVQVGESQHRAEDSWEASVRSLSNSRGSKLLSRLRLLQPRNVGLRADGIFRARIGKIVSPLERRQLAIDLGVTSTVCLTALDEGLYLFGANLPCLALERPPPRRFTLIRPCRGSFGR